MMGRTSSGTLIVLFGMYVVCVRSCLPTLFTSRWPAEVRSGMISGKQCVCRTRRGFHGSRHELRSCFVSAERIQREFGSIWLEWADCVDVEPRVLGWSVVWELVWCLPRKTLATVCGHDVTLGRRVCVEEL